MASKAERSKVLACFYSLATKAPNKCKDQENTDTDAYTNGDTRTRRETAPAQPSCVLVISASEGKKMRNEGTSGADGRDQFDTRLTILVIILPIVVTADSGVDGGGGEDGGGHPESGL